MSAKYKPVAAAMWPDVMDWLVKEHANDIIKLYEKLFSAYLSKTYGNLTPEVRKALIKELMTNIIY